MLTWKEIKNLLNSSTVADDTCATELTFGPPHMIRIKVEKLTKEPNAHGGKSDGDGHEKKD